MEKNIFSMIDGIWKEFFIIKLLKPAQTVIAQHFNERLFLLNDVLEEQKLFSLLGNQPMILLHNNFYHNFDNAMHFLDGKFFCKYSLNLLLSDNHLQHFLFDQQLQQVNYIKEFLELKSELFFDKIHI